MTVSKKITLNSSGKINLYLNVSKDLRPDGYHEIKSIMQSISLSDVLDFEVNHNYGIKHIEPGNGSSKSKTGGVLDSNGISITCNNVDIPLNEKNLVHKAAHLILKNFNLEKKYNIKINIKKTIPVGAGLAGGSSNAAATLIALDRIFNLKLSEENLKAMGNQVGSDVPFCISGGTALVEGKGELISQLPDLPFYWVVVAINGKKFSSGDVYDKFDLIGKSKKPVHDSLVKNLVKKNYQDFFKSLDNDLEGVVVCEDTMVTVLKNRAMELGAFTSQMTGSGPAIFAFCDDLKIARSVHSGLCELSDKVFLTYTTPFSQSIMN
jgi:4-diphosphocytidyl-2-C-methyl-D-erythritol kinase